MRSVIRVRQQILAGLGAGLALAAGVACGGSVVPSDSDGSTPGTGGTGGATEGSGGSGGTAGSGTGASTGTGGANPTGAGGATGTGGSSDTGGTGGTTGTGGSSGTTTGTGGIGGTVGTGGSGGGTTTTTTGTGGIGGTVGTGGSSGGTTTTTGTGGVGGTVGTGGSGGGTTTTTGTGGAAGGIGGTGGTGGSGPPDAGCPPEAGSPEPVCEGNLRVCFSAAALARHLKSPVDAGSSVCALPNPCPSAVQFQMTYACAKFFSAYTAPPPENGQCCYPFVTAVDGRPFIVDGQSRHADVIERADWCAARHEWSGRTFDRREGRFDRSDDRLTPTQRARLAEAWLVDAKAEHASIASFARLTLQLLSLGAPPELLIATQRATKDEIAHAELCFALASRFAGRPLGPSELAMSGAVTDVTLVELAVAAVHEGCVGETMAAVLAGERLEQARDPQVRAALAKIAKDEGRHAELAWRTVVWAIERGGQSVYDAVRAAFDEAVAPYADDARHPDDDAIDDLLASHGRAAKAAIRRAQAAVVHEIVRPIAASLSTLIAAKNDTVDRPAPNGESPALSV